MDILIIKENFGKLILDGKKSWEIRGCNTTKRGKIAIAFSGTKKIYGYVELVDSFSLTEELFEKNRKKLHTELDSKYKTIKYKTPYAWVMKNPVKLKIPKPYNHPYGAVIWVKQ